MNRELLFAARDLRFTYGGDRASSGEPALRIDDLRIERGDFVSFVGGNGAGKTTLLKILNGLIRPMEGTIEFCGQTLVSGGLDRLRATSVLVHQQPYLFVGSVSANVAYGLKVRHTDHKTLQQIVSAKLALLGLEDLASRRARELSGGEQQRVAVARALALEPEVLFLDEPTAHMDVGSKRILEGVLRGLHRGGTTLIMSSHELEFAYRLADRITVIENGKIAPNQENIFRGNGTRREGGFLHFRVSGGELKCPDREGDFVTAVIAATDIILSDAAIETSAQNQFSGLVVNVEHTGSLVQVEIDCGFTLRAIITEHSREYFQVKPGRELIATFKASAVRLY